MRNPPILISVIGFFAALAGFGYLFFGLRVIGFDWFGIFGDLPQYDSVGLWGWLAVFVGIVWILVGASASGRCFRGRASSRSSSRASACSRRSSPSSSSRAPASGSGWRSCRS